MTTRRDFLLGAAALGLCGCSRSDAPKWLGEALKQLRDEDRPGLLFRLPADKDGRCSLGHSITHYLLNSKDAEVHEVLSETTLLCLESAVVDGRFRGRSRCVVMDQVVAELLTRSGHIRQQRGERIVERGHDGHVGFQMNVSSRCGVARSMVSMDVLNKARSRSAVTAWRCSLRALDAGVAAAASRAHVSCSERRMARMTSAWSG